MMPTRLAYLTVLVTVEYDLTSLDRTLIGILDALSDWRRKTSRQFTPHSDSTTPTTSQPFN
jgi:DNA-binding HxlR family transcriptional regulator